MKLAFALGKSNEYQIVTQSGRHYTSSDSGEYHWGEYDTEENSIMLTLKNEKGETAWKGLSPTILR